MMQVRGEALTLPARWYVDPILYELEQERVFGRTWQWVGRADQVASPGSYFTCRVAHEPVVVVRGQDGKLRALSNVCRHRAGPVSQGAGVVTRFQCAYHGWTYELDGTVLGTPFFRAADTLDWNNRCLPQFLVDTWGPLTESTPHSI